MGYVTVSVDNGIIAIVLLITFRKKIERIRDELLLFMDFWNAFFYVVKLDSRIWAIRDNVQVESAEMRSLVSELRPLWLMKQRLHYVLSFYDIFASSKIIGAVWVLW